MIGNVVRVLLLVAIVGCRASASTDTATPAASAPAPAPAATPTPAPAKRDVEVLNVGGAECKVAVWAGTGLPPAEQATIDLPVGRKTMQLAMDESLAVKGADGKFMASARSDGAHGQIVLADRCSTLAVADLGFSPERIARMARHDVDSCCTACAAPKGCTGCTDPKAGASCTAPAAMKSKCALWNDVLDCVPATAVDADGRIVGDYAANAKAAAPR